MISRNDHATTVMICVVLSGSAAAHLWASLGRARYLGSALAALDQRHSQPPFSYASPIASWCWRGGKRIPRTARRVRYGKVHFGEALRSSRPGAVTRATDVSSPERGRSHAWAFLNLHRSGGGPPSQSTGPPPNLDRFIASTSRPSPARGRRTSTPDLQKSAVRR